MIYLYGILLIANALNGIISFIAGNYEVSRHEEIITFLIVILITLETKGK